MELRKRSRKWSYLLLLSESPEDASVRHFRIERDVTLLLDQFCSLPGFTHYYLNTLFITKTLCGEQ
ncbi:hypothetical protein OUZ56_028610 [Daphnia magna]|uniref:Uncharacterized protein n=1 Tax=Daphnia magna TaxID=35525 RepID=A0ABR0B4D3_9CRUS|nr:hypothetical protein OUZ56_028610 [Daphnia magna]